LFASQQGVERIISFSTIEAVRYAEFARFDAPAPPKAGQALEAFT
jgi:hypothetical protein